jgi:hypothetical protein
MGCKVTSWLQFVVGVNSKVHKVKWKVCSKIEGDNKILVPKLSSLWKHVGWRKTIITTIGVIVTREYYFLKMNQHVINKCLYVSKGKSFVV